MKMIVTIISKTSNTNSFLFVVVVFLSFHRNQKQKSNFQQVDALPPKTTFTFSV